MCIHIYALKFIHKEFKVCNQWWPLGLTLHNSVIWLFQQDCIYVLTCVIYEPQGKLANKYTRLKLNKNKF